MLAKTEPRNVTDAELKATKFTVFMESEVYGREAFSREGIDKCSPPQAAPL